MRGTALQNRQFLGRAVRYLAAEQGISQFLDIGTGLPTMNSVHEVTQSVAPDSRVVYVDNDPVVLAHARDLLHGLPGTMTTSHDLRDPEAILSDPASVRRSTSASRSRCCCVAVLHFVADADDPAGIVSALMAATPPGSCLAISHLTADHYTHADRVEDIYADTTPGLHLRSRAGGRVLVRRPAAAPARRAHLHRELDRTRTPTRHPPRAAGPTWCGVARKAVRAARPAG